MPQIKITELPVKKFADGIDDTDIMVIEDSFDTKKISIKDLKLVFDTDEKIDLLKKNLESQINGIRNSLDSFTSTYDTELKTIKGQYSTVNQDITDVKKKMSTLQQAQLELESQIKNLQDAVDTNTDNIQSLTQQSILHGNNISSLKQQVSEHSSKIIDMNNILVSNSNDIALLKQKTEILSSSITSTNNSLQKNIDNLKAELINYANTLYDHCVEYIDYYHHIHEDPPNFDEDYTEKDDPTVAYIMPVGAIYETMDKDYDPNNHLPGEWYFCGLGTATETSSMKQVQYYTWTRTK